MDFITPIVIGGYVPHSKLNLSAAEVWRNCHGSANEIKNAREKGTLIDDETEHSFTGNVAHYLGEQALSNGDQLQAYLGVEFKSESGAHSLVVSQGMIDTVQIYIDHCDEVKARFSDAVTETEIYRELRELGIDGLNGGTLDHEVVSMSAKTIVVIDYKNGTGRGVPADNWQTKGYGLGSLLRINKALGGSIADWCVPDFKVEVHIVQPLDYRVDEPVKRTEYTAGQLRAWALNELIPTAELSSMSTKLTPGDHCDFCSLSCCAMRAAGSKVGLIADHLIESHEPVAIAAQLSTEQITALYKHEKTIKAVLKQVEATIRLSVERSEGRFPFAFGPGRKVRVINELEAFDEDFGKARQYLDYDQVYKTVTTTEHVGVGELTKLLTAEFRARNEKKPKQKAESIVDEVCDKKEGKPTLVESETTLPGQVLLDHMKKLK